VDSPFKSLYGALACAAAAHPDRIAVCSDRDRVSFADLTRRAGGIQAELRGAGARPETRVLLIGPNSTGYVAAFFAITSLGCAVIPVDWSLTSHELSLRVSDSAPQAVVACDGDQKIVHDQVAGNLAAVPGLASLPMVWATSPWSLNAGPAPGQARILSDALAVAIFTSGTTGQPTIVEQTHADLLAATSSLHSLHRSYFSRSPLQAFRSVLALVVLYRGRLLTAARHQTWLSTSPFSTMAGLQVLLGCLLRGDTLALTPLVSPRAVLSAIERERVNVLATSPALARLLVASKHPARHDTSSLLVIGLGGAQAAPELIEKLEGRFHCSVTVGYGSAEATGGILATRLTDTRSARHSSVGKPFPGVAVAIVDDLGRECSPGTPGELAFKRDKAGGGWHRTGDCARLDSQGNVTILGRLGEAIKRNDRMIFPAEIEQVIETYPGVTGSGVIGHPEPDGTQIAAYVEGPGDLSLEGLRLHCQSLLSGFRVPDHFYRVSSLPRTADGKVQKFRLKTMREQPGQPGRSSLPQDRATRTPSG
jgi:long-chain acyl-CoA synthetase